MFRPTPSKRNIDADSFNKDLTPKLRESPISNSVALIIGLGLIAALATWFYFPALFRGRTLANGDIAIIDRPFFELFARVIKGEASPLWASGIFGGHPIFAEGQAGFAHPLNFLWAAIVTPAVGPVYAMNLFYWALNILGAVGLIGLCRSLGINFWAAAFAALAVVYSPLWTYLEYVLPTFHTLTWIPWSLWAFEIWLKRPSVKSSVLLAGACALVFLSGFPQGLHGTVIYMALMLLVAVLRAPPRTVDWRRLGTFGLLACGICIGLAAIQLIPLLELIPLSTRSDGAGITFGGTTPAASYLRGFLMTRGGSDASYFPGPGSLLVCALASVAILLPKPSRIAAHALASFVLVLLGMEFASPLFRLVYDQHLLPGLHYFREMNIYLAIATIGIGVTAAFGIDALAQWIARKQARKSQQRFAWRDLLDVRVLVVAAFWISAGFCIKFNTVAAIHLAFVLMSLGLTAVLVRSGRLRLLAPVMTAVLTFEILVLRMHPFNFFDREVFAMPPQVPIIQKAPDWREYKVMTGSLAGTIALFSPLQSDLANRVRKAFSAISPMTNILWGLSSLNGYLPLPLARRTAVEPLLEDEMFGRNDSQPGLRLIDLLSVRFVTNGGELSTAGFKTLYLDERREIQTLENKLHSLQENTAALPRFQFYSDYEIVDSVESAIVAIKRLKTRKLVIENPNHVALPPSNNHEENVAANAPSKIQLRAASDTEYRVTVTSDGGWLFLADANYPGWTATVDGREVPVFSADVLGKAMPVPGGSHDVVLKFRSLSFYIGLFISLLTLAISSLWAIFETARSRLPALPG